MSLTPSNMVPLRTVAKDFELYDTVSGTYMSLKDIKSDIATVVMFICNHCPYVKHVKEELVRISKDYMEQGVAFVGICSNDVENYPEDSPDKMRDEAKAWGYPFPYLYDETQQVARDYDAACTPDFYLYDKNMELVYRGQLDDSRPGNEKSLDGKDLRAALDSAVQGNPVNENQVPSVGCNIKWKNQDYDME